MNCKPGDLATIVAPFEPAGRGLVVSVVAAVVAGEAVVAKNGGVSRPSAGFHMWRCDAHDERFPCVIADIALRPIRDPGDDAVDETLQRLPAPKQDTVWQPKRQVENA